MQGTVAKEKFSRKKWNDAESVRESRKSKPNRAALREAKRNF